MKTKRTRDRDLVDELVNYIANITHEYKISNSDFEDFKKTLKDFGYTADYDHENEEKIIAYPI